jgi:RNA polymerase sigma-70 factor (ECF subfamily)
LPEGALVSDSPGPAAALETAETRKTVRQALQRLSLDEREVVVLRHYQGMRFGEIAELLGASESTVKSRMRYALDKLSNILRPLEKEPQ